jgi:hypothetical protein
MQLFGAVLASASPYAFLKSWFFSGSERMRLPVAEKMALHNAGATTATGGLAHAAPGAAARQ